MPSITSSNSFVKLQLIPSVGVNIEHEIVIDGKNIKHGVFECAVVLPKATRLLSFQVSEAGVLDQ